MCQRQKRPRSDLGFLSYLALIGHLMHVCSICFWLGVMKNIPNILSVSRIALSVLLLFFFGNATIFFSIYIAAGLTDVLDGFIARKYRVVSELGAKLDSAGDLFFYGVLTAYLIVVHQEFFYYYLWYLIFIAAVRIINIITGFVKYKKFIGIHTYANKLTGFLIFALPIVLYFNFSVVLNISLIIASIASVEEFLIIISGAGSGVDLNKKSIL